MNEKKPPQAWRCTVCGHIHRGPTPPEFCEVCGAPQEDFEPFAETARTPPRPAPRRWRCAVCGYIHEGPEPPDECPLCGAPRGEFEALPDEPAGAGTATDRHVVIAGAGAAGLAAAEAARRSAPACRITLLSHEAEAPYYRLNLTRYLAGEVTRPELRIHPPAWYAERRIELLTGVTATGLDLDGHRLAFSDGTAVAFDTLVLASGASAFVPPVPGATLSGVISLRTVEDADRLLAAVAAGGPCVCIGGGLLGLEAAAALARRGVAVTVLESAGHLMPSQLDARAGALLAAHLAGAGVVVRVAVRVREIAGVGCVEAVVLESGERLPAGVVLLATGVRANARLAADAGLAAARGVLVDDHLRTSHADVLAAGDVAEHRGMLYGSWLAAQHQGAVAGANAAGDAVTAGALPRSHTLKVVGLDTFSVGQFTAPDGDHVAVAGERDGAYASFVLRGGVLVGATLVGRLDAAAAARRAVEEGCDLLAPLRRGASAFDLADALLARLPGA